MGNRQEAEEGKRRFGAHARGKRRQELMWQEARAHVARGKSSCGKSSCGKSSCGAHARFPHLRSSGPPHLPISPSPHLPISPSPHLRSSPPPHLPISPPPVLRSSPPPHLPISPSPHLRSSPPPHLSVPRPLICCPTKKYTLPAIGECIEALHFGAFRSIHPYIGPDRWSLCTSAKKNRSQPRLPTRNRPNFFRFEPGLRFQSSPLIVMEEFYTIENNFK